MPGRPPVDTRREQDNLKQKRRLKYLLDKYTPPVLRGVELYRRLRLHPRGQTEKAPKAGTPLPSSLASRLPYLSEKDFGYLLETDTSKRAAGRYLPGQGLNRNLCDALAWVIAEAYEFWPDGPSADVAGLDQIRQQISDFISNGTSQPAQIFFGIDKHLAEEITYASREEIAPQHQQQSFLRGEARPGLSIVNGDSTIERDCEARVYREICEGSLPVILLTSAAGDGKSTLLYRLAQRLFDEDWRVLIKHEWLFDSEPSWPLGQDARTNTVLFIDRAESLRDLKSLYFWVTNNPTLRVVLAAREIDWVRQGHPLKSPRHNHVPLPRLIDREINDLAALLLARRVAEPPASLDDMKQRLRHSIRETNYPHMLAAAMTACRGAQFSVVLNSMIEKFPYPDLLKLVALCAAGTDIHSVPTYATHRLMSALFCESNGEPIEDGGRRFAMAHRQVSSEIITIHGSRYDLRHPDITDFTLRHLYESDSDGALRKVVEIEDDLFRIMQAVVRIRLREPRRIRQGVPDNYIYDIPRSWWSSKYIPDHGVGRELYEDVHEQLGNLNADRRLRANLLRGWLDVERIAERIDSVSIDIQRKWLPYLTEIISESAAAGQGQEGQEELSNELYQAYRTHIDFAVRQNELGNFANPELGTARYLLREMWNWSGGKFRGTRLLRKWRDLETTKEGLGSIEGPLPYTIRWLFQSLWKDETRRSPSLMTLWARTEIGVQPPNIGENDDPAKYSARWIFREAWKSRNLLDPYLVVEWAQMEAESSPSNIGDKDKPDDFSARWICRETWKIESLRSAEMALRWAQIETDASPPNIGDKDTPDDYSARWIFREAWKAESLRNAEMALRWAQMETAANPSNIGEKANPHAYSARWIFQETWKNHNLTNPKSVLEWAQMETNASPSNIGDKDKPDDYTARWVFREAWKVESLRNADMALRWAQMEAAAANPPNVGDKDNPDVYSARWIFREAWKLESLRNAEMARRWAQMEADSSPSNIGDKDKPDNYSARWIFREAWKDRNLLNSNLVLRWAKMETDAKPPNIGDKDNPDVYTGRWIFREAWKLESLRNAEMARRWAQMEFSAKPSNIGDNANPDTYSARWIFREAWKNHSLLKPKLVREWAQMETDARPSNIGDKGKPDEYSARWIFRQNYELGSRDSSVMLEWAILEIAQKNFGEDSTSSEVKYTARWIATRCSPKSVSEGLLGCIAAEEGNMGDFCTPSPGTARFIFRQSYEKGYPDIILRLWAGYEYNAAGQSNNFDKQFGPKWIFDLWKKRSGNPASIHAIEDWLLSDTDLGDTEV